MKVTILVTDDSNETIFSVSAYINETMVHPSANSVGMCGIQAAINAALATQTASSTAPAAPASTPPASS